MMYQLKGEYSQMTNGDWEHLPCVISVVGEKVHFDRAGQEMRDGDITRLPYELSFHREWTEVTDGLCQLKVEYPQVYAAIIARSPLRPSHIHLMEPTP